MVNKKIFISIGMIFCMCFTCSCGRQHLYSNNDEIITTVGEAIVQDFINNDFEGIKEYLSPKALETADLYEGFSYVHGLLTESEIVNVEQKGTPISGHKEKGASWEKGSTSFHITMSSGVTYCLYFEYWFVNQIDEEMLGVSRVEIFNNDEADETYDLNKFSSYIGIYNPGWGDFLKVSDN